MVGRSLRDPDELKLIYEPEAKSEPLDDSSAVNPGTQPRRKRRFPFVSVLIIGAGLIVGAGLILTLALFGPPAEPLGNSYLLIGLVFFGPALLAAGVASIPARWVPRLVTRIGLGMLFVGGYPWIYTPLF